MLQIHHFTEGLLTPVLAYVMSVVGSVLAMRCEVHARSARWPGGWLLAAAIALGGCGIWVMHFTAMLGFSIQGATIRYDVPVTLLSAAIAIVVVWIGLSIVVRVQREWLALPIGGGITGLGVAAMHYLGMDAMHTDAGMSYNHLLVALSIVIGVVAATAALWFIRHVRGLFATLGAALIMGVAVCGMHYTGMASLRVFHTTHPMMTPAGVEPVQLLTPLIMIVTVITMMLIVLVGLAELDERKERREPMREVARADDGTGLITSGRAWPRADQVRPSADYGLKTANQGPSSWPVAAHTSDEEEPAEWATPTVVPTAASQLAASRRARLAARAAARAALEANGSDAAPQ